MRQGTHISKDLHHFKGTENDRVKNMLKEADDFVSRLKAFKKHINENTASITGQYWIRGLDHICEGWSVTAALTPTVVML